MNKNTYITTSIPYVNAAPHVGYALEVVQADTVARYKRLTGTDVFFTSGSDENSLKNVRFFPAIDQIITIPTVHA